MRRIAGYLKIFLPSSDPNDNVITNCSNKLFNSIQKTCSNELLNSGIYFTILKKRIFRVFYRAENKFCYNNNSVQLKMVCLGICVFNTTLTAVSKIRKERIT